MDQHRLRSLIFSTKGKIAIGLVVGLLLLVQVVPGFIPTQPYVDKVVAQLKAATGADVAVSGGVGLKLFPTPILQLRDVRITQPQEAHAPQVKIAQLDITADLVGALTGNPQPKSIILWEPDIRFEQDENERILWGYLGASLFKNLDGASSLNEIALVVQSAKVTVADKASGQSWAASNIQAGGVLSKEASLKGSFDYQGKPVQFEASRTGRTGVTPFTLALSQGKDNTLSLHGSIDFSAAVPVATGKITIAAANIRPFLFPEESKVASAFETVNNQSVEVAKTEVVIPLKLTADYTQKQDMLVLSNAELESQVSKATGQLSWSSDAKREERIALKFSTLDITRLVPLLYTDKTKTSNLQALLADKKRNISIEVNADEVVRGEQKWSGASFNGTIADGALTVNQFSISLPGESKLSLFGLISQTDVQGMRFEGTSEAYGESLRDLLTVFDESAKSLPAIGFGKFNIRSNLFISSELLRLSESDIKFSEIALKGGMVAYFDAKPRIEANVRLRDINFDYVRDAWRERAAATAADSYFLSFSDRLDYEWLKKLATSIDFKVEVDGFTFLERKGKDASFRILARSGEFGIYNGKFNFGTDVTEANLMIDVKGDKPNVNLMLNTNAFSTDYFAVKPAFVVPDAPPLPPLDPSLPDLTAPIAPTPLLPGADSLDDPSVEGYGEASVPPQAFIFSTAFAQQPAAIKPDKPSVKDNGDAPVQWSENLLDMSWMEMINGTFDISIGKLTHQSRLFQNFKMFAKLERNLLTFQTLTFAHWGGSFSINGTLYGGKVPGMSMGFVLASADLKQLLASMLGVVDVGGKVSVSGTIETSGVNLLSWVSQANAQLLFAGRGVNIRGLDVASVLMAVAASRTAADTFNNVNLSLVSGTGEYSVDGTLNVQNGVMSTAGISMKTGRALGNLKGELRLLPWTLAMSAVFQFPELAADTVPTMTLKWDGPLAKPEFQVDTQSLEAFVAKRITGN